MSQDPVEYENAGDEEQWDDVEDEGVLDATETLDDDHVRDPLDVGYEPTDRWSGANSFGTTPAEERQGESLDQLLSEEEPDVDDDADLDDEENLDEDELTRRGYERDERAGRLVDLDEGFGEDDEADSVANDVGVDSGAATAEEAAVHIEDDPEDPDYGPPVR